MTFFFSFKKNYGAKKLNSRLKVTIKTNDIKTTGKLKLLKDSLRT